MSATATAPTQFLLPEDMLKRFRERAPVYDQENRFYQEDFEELRDAGYLRLAVPEEFGGLGRTLPEYIREVARLASYAPPTALATNMHMLWTGVAGDMVKQGIDPGNGVWRWLLEGAAASKVFANGHGERGNDLNGFLSTVEAKKVPGGYRITGHKIFGSMTPVWDWLAFWAMDADHPEGPHMIHGFIPRSAENYRIVNTWDTLGMRATQSDDTIFEGTFAPDEYICDIVPAGGASPMLLSAFAWAETGFGSVYNGVASRAIELAVQNAHKRTSIALTRPMAYHPEIQHEVAEMVIAHEAAVALIDRIASDWATGVDHGANWFLKQLTAKHVAVEAAQRVVDLAMRVSGGTGMFKSSELERLYRDVRCGGFHPANSMLVHEIVGKTALGIDPGEQPRWG